MIRIVIDDDMEAQYICDQVLIDNFVVRNSFVDIVVQHSFVDVMAWNSFVDVVVWN